MVEGHNKKNTNTVSVLGGGGRINILDTTAVHADSHGGGGGGGYTDY